MRPVVVITCKDSRLVMFLKHHAIMTFKKKVKFECHTEITSSQSLSMAYQSCRGKEIAAKSSLLFPNGTTSRQ